MIRLCSVPRSAFAASRRPRHVHVKTKSNVATALQEETNARGAGLMASLHLRQSISTSGKLDWLDRVLSLAVLK